MGQCAVTLCLKRVILAHIPCYLARDINYYTNCSFHIILLLHHLKFALRFNINLPQI